MARLSKQRALFLLVMASFPLKVLMFKINGSDSDNNYAGFWKCRLDVGEGRDVNIEKCPRSKLQQQCIKYLGPVSLIFLISWINHLARFFVQREGVF